MLSPSLLRACMRIVFVLFFVLPVQAPYAQDVLSDDERDAIERTYTLQAKLEQDSQAHPANAQTNKEKISLLGQARAELARVYTTPLTTEGNGDRRSSLSDDTPVDSDSELARIHDARQTIIDGIPASADGLGDDSALKEQLVKARSQRRAVEAKRSDKKTGYLRAQAAEIERLTKTEIPAAQKHLEDTGDPARFEDTQRRLRELVDQNGPLKSTSALTSSPEIERARKEFQTVTQATRVLETAIKEKAARGENITAHEAQHTLLLTRIEKMKFDLQRANESAQKLNHKKLLATAREAADFKARSARSAAAAAATADEEADDNYSTASTSGSSAARSRSTGAGDATETAMAADDTPVEDLIDKRKAALEKARTRYNTAKPTAIDKKQRAQAERDLADLAEQERLLTRNADGSEKTPEQSDAAKEDLRRDLLARKQFEDQVTQAEVDRLMAPAENDARRAAAEALFKQIDDTETTGEEAGTAPHQKLLEQFKKLRPADQLELMEYLKNPAKALPVTEDGRPHPFAAFVEAVRAHASEPALSPRLATSASGAAADGESEPTVGQTRSSASIGSANTSDTAPRNLFEAFYEQEYGKQKAAAEEQANSPLTRARLYKENAETFARMRQQVDTAADAAIRATRGSPDSDRSKAITTTAQLTKAQTAAGRIGAADVAKIQEKNATKLAETKEAIPKHADGSPATDEEARQLMVLTKANAYYKAIQETVESLRLKLESESQQTRQKVEALAAQIEAYKASGEEVPTELEASYKQAAQAHEEVQQRAIRLVDAFKTDPVPFLTAKTVSGGGVSETDEDGIFRDSVRNKGDLVFSDQLKIFREALARQNIQFWKDEDVAPEIANALNLLKNPKAILEEDPKHPVKNVVREYFQAHDDIPTPTSLGNALEGPQFGIAKSLGKIQRGIDVYQDPAVLSLKAAAAKKDITAHAARSLSPEEARAGAALRIAEHRASETDNSELTPLTRKVRLIILTDADGNMVEHEARGVFLMTEEEATKEAETLPGAKLHTITLDLSDLSPDSVRTQLHNNGFDDDAVEAILPSRAEGEAGLATELSALRQQKEELAVAAQEQRKARALLAAKRGDSIFIAETKDMTLDDTSGDGEDSEHETDMMQKKLKHFDLVRADYEKDLLAAGSDEEQQRKAHENYYGFLHAFITETGEHLVHTDFPLTRETRSLLLALNLEALDELRRPGINELNRADDDQIDPLTKAQSLTLTHLDAMHAEDQEREEEAKNPSAAAKRAQIEAKRIALETELAHRRATLVPNANLGETAFSESFKQKARQAQAEIRALQDAFDKESYEVIVKIREDMAATPEARIASLTDEAAQIRKQLKATGLDPEKNPRILEIRGLLADEDRVRTAADPAQKAARKAAKATARRELAHNFASALAHADSGVSATHRSEIAESMSSAGRDYKKAQRVDTKARKSARPTPRLMTGRSRAE